MPRILLVCVFFALISCHRRAKADDEPFQIAVPVLLEVENHNWADVVIYLMVDGKRYRFMEVSGAKYASKEIPPERQGTMGRLSFAIHRIGSQDEYRTETVSVRTGRTIRLTLETNLNRSSISIF